MNKIQLILSLLLSWIIVIPFITILSLLFSLIHLYSPVEVFKDTSNAIGLDDAWNIGKIKRIWKTGKH